MKQVHKNWRKATEDEIKNGFPEMVLVSEEEIEVEDIKEEKIDLTNIDIETLPDEQLDKLVLKLKEKLNI